MALHDSVSSSLSILFLARMSQKRATLYALATVLCWSTMATAFKLTLTHISPLQLVLIASTASWFFLLCMLLVQGRLQDLFKQNRTVYLWSLVFGLMNPILYYLLLFTAYDMLPAQEAQSINYSWAIVMSLLAVPLLAQRLSVFDIIAALLCYFGVLIIATRGAPLSLEFANFKGVALAVASTVVWSLYWILNQKDQREPVFGLCLNFSVALPLIVVAAFISGDLTSLASAHWHGLLGGVYIGVFEMGLAFVLWLTAMKLAENTARLANLIFISPFLSLVFIYWFLDEAILPSTALGLVFIVVGLGLQQRFAKQ